MKNKVGSIFLVSMLALAGLGMSYAGFSDLITVYGTVDTGTVDIELTGVYSGTWVYKNLDTQEVVVTHVPWEFGTNENPMEGYLLVAYAYAGPGTTTDVLMTWWNIFPCIDFDADFQIHYAGSIPGHITIGDVTWTEYDFSDYTFFYYYDNSGNPVNDWPLQMHLCENMNIVVRIHLQQVAELEGKSGTFGFNINAIQWYDVCP